MHKIEKVLWNSKFCSRIKSLHCSFFAFFKHCIFSQIFLVNWAFLLLIEFLQFLFENISELFCFSLFECWIMTFVLEKFSFFSIISFFVVLLKWSQKMETNRGRTFLMRAFFARNSECGINDLCVCQTFQNFLNFLK